MTLTVRSISYPLCRTRKSATTKARQQINLCGAKIACARIQ
jgi:hypothetical protein